MPRQSGQAILARASVKGGPCGCVIGALFYHLGASLVLHRMYRHESAVAYAYVEACVDEEASTAVFDGPHCCMGTFAECGDCFAVYA